MTHVKWAMSRQISMKTKITGDERYKLQLIIYISQRKLKDKIFCILNSF